MSQYLERIERSQPPALATPLPWTREARAMARNDRQSVVRARADYNNSKVQMHRIHLSTLLEKAEADQRADLAQYAMHKVVEVDEVANLLCREDRPALELTIRDIQNSFNTAEAARIIRRGFA